MASPRGVCDSQAVDQTDMVEAVRTMVLMCNVGSLLVVLSLTRLIGNDWLSRVNGTLSLTRHDWLLRTLNLTGNGGLLGVLSLARKGRLRGRDWLSSVGTWLGGSDGLSRGRWLSRSCGRGWYHWRLTGSRWSPARRNGLIDTELVDLSAFEALALSVVSRSRYISHPPQRH
jgi:hypothetical protein